MNRESAGDEIYVSMLQKYVPVYIIKADQSLIKKLFG